MTDEIKVGDRFLVPVEVTSGGSLATAIKIDGLHDSMMPTIWMRPAALSTCQRLPPEIGVGDKVRVTATTSKVGFGEVLHIYGDLAWVKWNTGGSALRFLSDLTLVKKAET